MKVITTSLLGFILLQNLPVNADCPPLDPKSIDDIHSQKEAVIKLGEVQRRIVYKNVQKVTPMVATTPGKCSHAVTVLVEVDAQ